MVHRPRPRAQLTGGGPTWQYRDGKRTSGHRGGTLVRGQAWEIVDRLPAHATWKHRRALGQYKLLIWALEAQQRKPRPPAS